MKYQTLFLLSLLGCGSSTTTPDEDSSVDSSTNMDSTAKDQSNPMDTSVKDSSAMDASTDDVMDAGAMDSGPKMGCQSPNDCKLFSSYCSTAACKCIPLMANQPNPVCDAGMVTCLIDPCKNKNPDCDDAGMCGVK